MALFRGTGGSGDASTDTYASEVAVEATRASTKANEAAASATSAASSASDSNSSALLALSAQFQADLFKQQAETSETNAGSFATQAGNSAQTAVLAKIGADTAQSAAEVAKTAAETAETNAETAETNASASATTATTKAGEASTSATSASTSATSASTSATSAATSATAAQTAQTAAEAAQSAAETAKEAIDGLYLGTASSNPTVDGNGDAVTVGDWYFNTSDNTTRIYDGSTWNTINPDLVGDTTPQLGGNLDLNSNDITGTGNVNITGNVVLSGTVDGRDVATDGSKLDNVEANADVTDATNVTAAGALMDSEVTNLAQVKAFDSTDYATAAQGAKADTAHGWGNHASAGYLTSFTETNDLSTAVTWANVPDANITQSSVTQHQAALSVTESQISDLQSYITGNETITLTGAITGSGTTSIATTLSTIDGGTY
jgi:multidrug efflux pump subunit AcrA (membrane-fusion protein)